MTRTVQSSAGESVVRKSLRIALLVCASSSALAQPANDECEQAQWIPALPATVAGSTLGAAGFDADSGIQCGTPIDVATPGVWVAVAGTGTMLTATTCPGLGGSADYDTKLSVYCGASACSQCDIPICVAGDDDGPPADCPLYESSVSWCSDLDVPQLIFVHGYRRSEGNFTLRVSDSGQPCINPVSCFAPPPPGACCLPDSPYCVDVLLGQCDSLGGDFQGACTDCLTPIGTITRESSVNAPVPDFDPAGMALSQAVPSYGMVLDVDVGMEIDHSAVWDLTIGIEHVPSGTTRVLWDEECSAAFNAIRSTADDDGFSTVTCADAMLGPMDDVHWLPQLNGQVELYSFNGLDAAGPWEFFVSDGYSGETGIVESWKLGLVVGEPTCPDPTFCPGVSGLVVARVSGETLLSWTAGAATARYDVAGGFLAELPSDGDATAAICLATDLLSAEWSDTGDDPPPGQARYYLVRSQDLQCSGGYGHASAGPERMPLTACH